jgi:AcrR family transcriptional regulator
MSVDTRERMIKAAMDVSAEYGFHKASTQMIAKRAYVSKGLASGILNVKMI